MSMHTLYYKASNIFEILPNRTSLLHVHDQLTNNFSACVIYM